MPSPTAPLILCEGRSDEVFIENLLLAHSLTDFEIQKLSSTDQGGSSGFERRLTGLKAFSGIEKRRAIILIRDNDDNPTSSFQDTQNQIMRAGDYTLPVQPRELSSAGTLPPISILMLPWDNEQGCLETLLLRSAWEKNPEIAQCVKIFVRCVNAENWEISKNSKLHLRCLLSAVCRDDPMVGLPFVWTSAKTRNGELIPLAHDSFQNLAAYFRGFGTAVAEV